MGPFEKARQIGILAGTRKPCTCCYCGNPRKYLGQKTVQERKHQQAEDPLDDV